jgi:hypothetical protein
MENDIIFKDWKMIDMENKIRGFSGDQAEIKKA